MPRPEHIARLLPDAPQSMSGRDSEITPATRPEPQPRPNVATGGGHGAPARGVGWLRQLLAAMFASKMVRLALLVSVIGLAMWVYAAATRPGGAEAAGLAEVASAISKADAAQTRRAIDSSAPATFRFGLSFVVGFFVGWCTRHLLRITLLVAGGIAIVTVALHKFGIASTDWSAVQQTADQSVRWIKGEGEAIGKFVTGYVPSVFTAGLGVFWGFRRR